MRLLNIETFMISEFHGSKIPPYLIASHRWFTTEPTFKDVCKRRKQECPGYQKIQGFCNVALKASIQARGICHLWIDTCCIDKSNNTELAESINSMMRYYRDSQCCLVYLADVGPLRLGREVVEDEFYASEWFRRAWTLQELLAPRSVLFFNRDWEIIGHKGKLKRNSAADTLYRQGDVHDLTMDISEITGISRAVLRSYKRSKKLSFAEKRKWARGRDATRVEDLAYCLLGIFEVHIPLIYGEGIKAHDRLVKEIEAQEQAKQEKVAAKRAKKLAHQEQHLLDTLFSKSQSECLPIMPPRSGIEDELVTEIRHAGIVSCLTKNMCGLRSSDLPVIVTAETLRRLGYADPGEAMHQAVFHVDCQSLLVREASQQASVLGWSRSRAVAHMINVLERRGHARDTAVAIYAVYLSHDIASFARLQCLYIEPTRLPGQDDLDSGHGAKTNEVEDEAANVLDSALGSSIGSISHVVPDITGVTDLESAHVANDQEMTMLFNGPKHCVEAWMWPSRGSVGCDSFDTLARLPLFC